MFDRLSHSLQRAFQRLSPGGKLSEAHLREGLREIRLALLEADVPLEVVRPLLERVHAKALGALELPGVQPTQQVIAAMHDELVALLGPVDTRILAAIDRPTVILLLGLQGTGKTTTAAKLARYLKRTKRRSPLLVAADLQRPAAAEQLTVLAASIDVPVFRSQDARQGTLGGLLRRHLSPAEVCRQGIAEAAARGHDVVILDTAGRLHVDAALMNELRQVREVARPDRCLLVCDAMTGQDALRSARAFHQAVPLDGVILSKTDGDTRGGAALAVKALTGKPIVFLGTGEKLDDLEELRPEGLASRILGKGDAVRLVHLAKQHVDEDRAARAATRLQRGKLDLEDFLEQLRALQRMGFKRVLGLLPGMGALREQVDGEALKRIEAMLCSMTREERRRPHLLSGRTGGGRRRRIARGSGHRVQEVNRFVRDFKKMQRLLRRR